MNTKHLTKKSPRRRQANLINRWNDILFAQTDSNQQVYKSSLWSNRKTGTKNIHQLRKFRQHIMYNCSPYMVIIIYQLSLVKLFFFSFILFYLLLPLIVMVNKASCVSGVYKAALPRNLVCMRGRLTVIHWVNLSVCLRHFRRQIAPMPRPSCVCKTIDVFQLPTCTRFHAARLSWWNTTPNAQYTHRRLRHADGLTENAGHEIAGQNSVRPILHYYEVCISCYVAAKATYIRLLHGNIGFLGFFGPSSVKRSRTHIVLGWNM